MDLEDLAASASCRRADRYLATKARTEQQIATSKRWTYLGKDATTNQGMVRSGDTVLRGNIVTNGYIVEGETVEVTQGGGLVEIDAQKWVRPKPVKPLPYLPKKGRTEVWAVGYDENANNWNFVLINLITGYNRPLTSIPKQISGCAAPPPGWNPQSPSPPQPPGDLYLHVYKKLSLLNPSGGTTPILFASSCGLGTPVPINSNFVGTTGAVISLRSVITNEDWVYRSQSGTLIEAGTSYNWFSQIAYTYSRSSTPPPIDAASYIVLGSVAGGYSGFQGYLALQSDMIYQGDCGTSASYTPAPPVDSRNPNTSIPNSYEVRLSIGADRKPIVSIRHTPNCISPGTWNFEQSYTLRDPNPQDSANPIRAYGGRLTTDWRFQPNAFDCQSALKDELFVNVDMKSFTRLWFIAPTDRPATIPSFSPGSTTAASKISSSPIDPLNCLTFSNPSVSDFVAKNTSNGIEYIIHSIAALKL